MYLYKKYLNKPNMGCNPSRYNRVPTNQPNARPNQPNTSLNQDINKSGT
jgi:hypothetical protein